LVSSGARTLAALDADLSELFESVRQTAKNLQLPVPLYEFFKAYAKWFGNCREFIREANWQECDRIDVFVERKRDFEREMLRTQPRYQILETFVTDQVSILRHLHDNPPEPRLAKPVPRAKTTGHWSRSRVVFTVAYLTFCGIVDCFVFLLLGLTIAIAVAGVELAVLLGLPKLIEWLQAAQPVQPEAKGRRVLAQSATSTERAPPPGQVRLGGQTVKAEVSYFEDGKIQLTNVVVSNDAAQGLIALRGSPVDFYDGWKAGKRYLVEIETVDRRQVHDLSQLTIWLKAKPLP